MSSIIEIKVPDVGNVPEIDIVEVLVNIGDVVAVEQTLAVMETDKATMDLPASAAGIIKSLHIKPGDKVAEGSLIATVEVSDAVAESAPVVAPVQTAVAAASPAPVVAAVTAPVAVVAATSVIEIKVPDVGNVPEIDIVEVLIKAGDVVALEQTLAIMETDKATMDLPASAAGTIKSVHIKAGDKVSEGSLIATIEISTASAPVLAVPVAATTPVAPPQAAVSQPSAAAVAPAPVATVTASSNAAKPHATPSVRLFARELGVDLNKISNGSGRKGRIVKDDVKNFVKHALAAPAVGSAGAGIPSIPAVDFSQFGEIEEKPLSKIKRLTGQNLTRVWLNLPLVTYHDEVAIDEMEAFRKSVNAGLPKDAVKVTGLVFIMKALVAVMQKFPAFNSSLSADGERQIFKHYFHIGIAVDTPNGLVVPVIRDVDKKSILQLTADLAEKSELARTGKLKPADMQGGCMTISSLGGIGGTAFTPIVNAPEVAILGVTRSKVQPVWNGSSFEPKLMLPLDITYDHRVIDGAEGARFMEALKANLADIRRLLL